MYGNGSVARFCAVMVVVASSVSSAMAAPVTFNLGGDGGTNIVSPDALYSPTRRTTYFYGDAWEQTQQTLHGDLTLRITPGAYTAGVSGIAGTAAVGGQTVSGQVLSANSRDGTALVTQTRDGLGVMNNGTRDTDDTPNDVDGSSGGIFGTGWFDYLVLEFSEEVLFDYARFANYGATDRFHLIFDPDGVGDVGGAGDFLTDELGTSLTAVGALAEFAPGDSFATRRIGIAAIGNGSAWRLNELGVSFPASNPPGPDPQTPAAAPVPLPAAAWFLIAALGGLGVMGRFKRDA